MRDPRLYASPVLSAVGHLALVYGLSRLPRQVEPRAHPVTVAIHVLSPPPPLEPPPEPTPSEGSSTTPVFGVTMESTSQASSGPSMPLGNSVRAPEKRELAAAPVPGLAPPVPAYEVTTMPLPQGRCAGRYSDEARAAAIEGTVVLDLIVGEDGHVREVSVVSGLGYGLTSAAITAVKDCRFSPGEKDGTPVPVRVRGFKIRFVLNE